MVSTENSEINRTISFSRGGCEHGVFKNSKKVEKDILAVWSAGGRPVYNDNGKSYVFS